MLESDKTLISEEKIKLHIDAFASEHFNLFYIFTLMRLFGDFSNNFTVHGLYFLSTNSLFLYFDFTGKYDPHVFLTGFGRFTWELWKKRPKESTSVVSEQSRLRWNYFTHNHSIYTHRYTQTHKSIQTNTDEWKAGVLWARSLRVLLRRQKRALTLLKRLFLYKTINAEKHSFYSLRYSMCS